LREGLDLPEVSLVAILDADKEGFLRSARSLTQTAGRAARNLNGRVIMYADKITRSMKETIDGTNYRREKQLAYNEAHGITPAAIVKKVASVLGGQTKDVVSMEGIYAGPQRADIAADPVVSYMTPEQLKKAVVKTKKAMQDASRELDFISAAQYRDEMYRLEELLKQKEK
jgi:excinuclease ABC subunit B